MAEMGDVVNSVPTLLGNKDDFGEARLTEDISIACC